MSEVTRVVSEIEHGNLKAAEELLLLVYDELRRLAAQKLAKESRTQTLQATALVHEAYLRLVGGGAVPHWNSRGHFFAAAAEAMRRILIEQARHKNTQKAGGDLRRIHLSSVDPAIQPPNLDLLALNEALEKLEIKHPRKAQLVKLRFFGGLTNELAAEALGIAPSTADLDWAYAKAWLRDEMSADTRGVASP